MTLSGKVVFSSGKTGDFDIWTLNLVTKELEQLTTGTYWNDQPKWSPDGKEIVFVTNRIDGIPELWLMNEFGGDQRPLTESGKFHSSPVWSPDGKTIAFSANYNNSDEIEIWSKKSDGSGNVELVFQSPGMETDLTWSPDGSKILFSSPRDTHLNIW